RNVEASAVGGTVSKGRPNDKTMHRIASGIFDGEIFILHFHTYFEPFLFQQNREGGALSEPPFPATIAGIFFFEEPVHRPFDMLPEILSQQEPKFVSIGYLGRATLFFFFAGRRRGPFFVANGPDAKFVFRKQGWI